MSSKVDRCVLLTELQDQRLCRIIPLEEVGNATLQQGIALWRDIAGEEAFPARSAISARCLKPLLRNTTLVRVIDGGRDYEYRVVGDAYVMAHGTSFQGKKWRDVAAISPGFHAYIKPIYDRVVRTGEPIATCGWIERGAGSKGQVYCEYVYLPLGTAQSVVDHILIFAVYLGRDGVKHGATAMTGSFAD